MASGSILAFFVLTHFLNHALGLAGIDAMEAGRRYFNLLWRTQPGTALLYGSMAVHVALALSSLYERSTTRMPIIEAVKIISGFLLPFLLVSHVLGTRVEYSLFSRNKDYDDILSSLAASPGLGALQALALVVAWTHGAIGIWFWMRGRDWYRKIAPVFHMVFIAVPLLALFGYFAGLQEIRHLAAAPAPPRTLSREDFETLTQIRQTIISGLSISILLVLVFRMLPRKGTIDIRYPGGQIVTVSSGLSVLEASRIAGLPHVSVCGGRGRCSTCRVEVVDGLDGQPVAGERERATLDSIGAPENVRLACMFRPVSDVAVQPLVDPETLSPNLRQATEARLGRERKIVALFCDIRGFTEVTEKRLPYDVVFLLNRYFALVGEAVESSGGAIDKFIGDGAVALFGLDANFNVACRQALEATVKLDRGIQALNQSIGLDLGHPVRIAIGLHGGPAIVGKIGYGRATGLTAVGDVMNTASRLEFLAKQFDVELAVTTAILDGAGIVLPDLESHDLEIRGKQETVETCLIPSVRILESIVNPARAAKE